MNRESRRAAGNKGKVRSYTMTNEQIEALKQGAISEAADRAFVAMLGLPLMVLRKEHSFGKKRLEQFAESLLAEYRKFESGEISLEEIKENIFQETGMRIES